MAIQLQAANFFLDMVHKLVRGTYALPVLYNHTVASGHSFDVLAIDRFLVIN
jgi:hypothetical protein